MHVTDFSTPSADAYKTHLFPLELYDAPVIIVHVVAVLVRISNCVLSRFLSDHVTAPAVEFDGVMVALMFPYSSSALNAIPVTAT